jgi:hypothetical protein
VINGDVINGQESGSVSVREHTLNGGSVQNGSKLVNVDTYMDVQTLSVFSAVGKGDIELWTIPLILNKQVAIGNQD